ncbi:MAG: GPP34 family phosphoprotein [Planctomycetes bacterium]|nr:GPP34 family phosphoprotein [Planctomycetota bacterium]
MAVPPSLTLPEEVLLLALRDEQGTVASGAMLAQALGGAILAELLLSERLHVHEDRKPMVQVRSRKPAGDELLDECLRRVSDANRRAGPQAWVSRFGNTRQLKHRVARSLCRKGVLREDEDRILGLFRRKLYPERDPAPERAVLARLDAAIFSVRSDLEARTVVLVALADATGLLRPNFPKAKLKAAKKRIKQIGEGEVVGKATREAVQAVQAAVMVACMVPVIVSN